MNGNVSPSSMNKNGAAPVTLKRTTLGVISTLYSQELVCKAHPSQGCLVSPGRCGLNLHCLQCAHLVVSTPSQLG